MSDRMQQFVARYRGMVDEQLFELADQAEQLTGEARAALWAELGRRGITEQAAKREEETPEAEQENGSQDASPNPPELYSWGLLGTAPPRRLPPSEWAAVFSAATGSEAQRVQEVLATAGIETQLQIVILVSQAETEKALQIISEKIETDPDPNDAE